MRCKGECGVYRYLSVENKTRKRVMNLEHISASCIRSFYDVNQEPRLKPSGLWLSSPGAWASWSKDASASWVCTMEIAYNMFCEHPWASGDGHRIIRVDMSSQDQLYSFIERYHYEGYEYEVDWRKVQREFGGVYFYNIGKMPSSYNVQFHDDGCWILSIDVDSVCIWNKRSLGATHWTRSGS